jgi:hypothetical protein
MSLGFLGLAWLGFDLDKLWVSGLSLKLDQNLVKLKLFKNTNFYPKYSEILQSKTGILQAKIKSDTGK